MPFIEEGGDGEDRQISVTVNTDDFRDTVAEAVLQSSSNYSISESSMSIPDTLNEVKWRKHEGLDITSGIVYGTHITDMDTPNLKAWFVEQSIGDPDIRPRVMGQQYATGGIEGIAGRVLRDASREIGNMLPRSSPVNAFNSVTEDWPISARILLAKREAEKDRSEWPTYESDIENLAESSDPMTDEWQSTLSAHFPDNPFADDSLRRREAETIVYLRSCDEEITQEQLSEIQNHAEFRDTYNDTENLSVALGIHEFDSNVPRTLLEECAPPGDWPDDMDAGSIEQGICLFCGSQHYQLYDENENVVWGRSNGTTSDAVQFSEHDDYHYTSGSTDAEIMCGSCRPMFENESTRVTHADPDSGIIAFFDYHRSLVRDRSNEMDEASSFDELSDRDADELLQGIQGSRNRNGFMLGPNSNIGDPAPQREAIADIAENPSSLTEGPVTIARYANRDAGVFIHNSNAGAAHEVKSMMEEAVN